MLYYCNVGISVKARVLTSTQICQRSNCFLRKGETGAEHSTKIGRGRDFHPFTNPSAPEEGKQSKLGRDRPGQLKVQITRQVHSPGSQSVRSETILMVDLAKHRHGCKYDMAAGTRVQASPLGEPQRKSSQWKEEKSLLRVSSRVFWKHFSGPLQAIEEQALIYALCPEPTQTNVRKGIFLTQYQMIVSAVEHG